ncbi:MAG: sugar phosphate isomerase/epimerase [Candidatus Diapherotrites archaeon]
MKLLCSNPQLSFCDSALLARECKADGFEYHMEGKKSPKKTAEHGLIVIHSRFAELNLGAYNAQVRRLTINEVKKAIALAKRANANGITIHSGYCPLYEGQNGWNKRASDSIEELIKEAKKHRKSIFLENFQDSQNVMGHFSNSFSSKHFKLMLDLGHANIYAGGGEKFFERLVDKCFGIHAHNNFGKKDTHNSLAKGNIDYKKIVPNIGRKALILEMLNKRDFEDSINLINEIL